MATTLEEWKQTATALERKITDLEATQRQLQDQRFILWARQRELRQQRNALPPNSVGTPAYNQLNAELNSVNISINDLENSINQLSSEIVNTDASLQAAERQIDRLTQAPVNTLNTTPPASEEPGNNTAVTPPTNPVRTISPDEAFISDQEADILESQREEAEAVAAGIPTDVISDEEADLLEIQRDEGAANLYTAPEPAGDEAIAAAEEAELLRAQQEESDARRNQQPEPVGDEAIAAAEEAELLRAQQEEGIARLNGQPDPVGDEAIAAAEEAELLRAQQEEAAAVAAGQSQVTGTQQLRNSGTGSQGGASEVRSSLDTRLRISLAPNATYLYKDPAATTDPNHILHPLVSTQGVLFPYTPQISTTYSANYEATDLTHTNYRNYNYRNSGIDTISITGTFTAQDTYEANYMLAVIHFFRSVTKMFYGLDGNPSAGIPPPLCYITGYGTYGFSNHQVVVNTFTLNYPDDVDYISANPNLSAGNLNFSPYKAPETYSTNVFERIKQNSGKIAPGGVRPAPVFSQSQGASSKISTRVPTKIQIQISCLPVVTRYNISNNFSLKDYASGKLLQKGFW